MAFDVEALDSVVFVNRVHLADVLLLVGRINAVFGSSMEIEVEVHAEDPLSGEKRLTTCALVTMVAVDDEGRPRTVPRLALGTDEERERAAAAVERRRARLASRE